MSITSFFDVNAVLGKGVFGNSEYTTPEALISQMDYLGIDRGLVWSCEARDACTTKGNANLLERITAKEEYRKRLFPAFVVNPALVFDKQGLEFLKISLKSSAVRALRIFPASSRFSMATLERLFHELKAFNPVILWNFRDTNGRADRTELVSLAQKFPRFKFILTQLMWGQFNDALDMMWRSENILMDTSWLHMTDSIEILVDYFGPERVVFGCGFKSHYGASAAALAHSKIRDRDKEKIAHKNMEKLLKITNPEKNIFTEPDIIKEKPVWKKFREGKAVTEFNIIDCHAHLATNILGWTFRTGNPKEILDTIVKRMDSIGVKQTVLSNFDALFADPIEGNKELKNIVEKSGMGKRVSGYYSFNPHYENVLREDMEESFSRGFFKGFKLLPSYWKTALTDSRFRTVWKYADKYCLPILIHTWNDKYNSPGILKDIVKKYSRAQFILGHSGGGTEGRLEAEELAMKNKNVYLEYCGSFTTPLDWVDTFDKAGFDNTVFGSDTYCHDLAWELGRLLSIPVPDQKLVPVFSSNFEKILSKASANPEKQL